METITTSPVSKVSAKVGRFPFFLLSTMVTIVRILHSIFTKCGQTCVQRSPLGNGKVTMIYRVTAIYRSTLQKI